MSKTKSITFIVLAGGTSTRFGGDLPKQFIKIAGLELFAHSIRTCSQFKQLSQIVVVVDSAYKKLAQKSLSFTDIPVTVCSPGATRQRSVFNALQAVDQQTDIVLIHDGARPAIKAELIQQLIDRLTTSHAAIPVIPVTDSIIQLDDAGKIKHYVDRSTLQRVQTPQAFFYKPILTAHKQAVQDGLAFTDDAGLFMHYGGKVAVVPGDSTNLKVTHPSDLSLLKL